MAARATKFADNATVNDLKEKLVQMGLSATGNKATLKLKLLENLKNLSEEQLLTYFPENVLMSRVDHEDVEDAEDRGSPEEFATGDYDGDDAFDAELHTLRQRVARKREIVELKRKLYELTLEESSGSGGSRSFVNFRDVEESLIQFSGDDGYSVHRWLQQFEESADVLGWDSRMKLIYGKRLMTGTARHFLRTTSFASWTDLKTALLKEFSIKVTSSEIHNRLRSRKKKREETLQQYVFAIQELASLANIEESDIIEYIINGIPDSNVNKMLLYSANNLEELKVALRKYDKIKVHSINENSSHQSKFRSVEDKQTTRLRGKQKCFNCNEYGHLSNKCPNPKRTRGSCFRCGNTGHRANECTETCKQVLTVNNFSDRSDSLAMQRESQTFKYEYAMFNNFVFNIRYVFGEDSSEDVCFSCSLQTLLDSGSAISFIQQQFVPLFVLTTIDPKECRFQGINGSLLDVVGIAYPYIIFKGKTVKINLFIVKNNSMKYAAILGRDFLNKNNLELANKNGKANNDIFCDQPQPITNQILEDILNIDVFDDSNKIVLDINDRIPFEIKNKIQYIVSEACTQEVRNSKTDDNKFEMTIRLNKEQPFYCAPRRLPYSQKLELEKMLKDLLEKGIVRESNSPYASPIVLVNKKNRELRLCVDYRELNKHTIRDNYPLPIIEDLLDRLRDKKYFTTLDLRNGFHHIRMAADSTKYTSFVTPIGQYEFVKMPFGLKNAPSVFQRYLNTIFRDLIAQGKLLIYMDDLLIATDSIENHLEVLQKVMELVKENELKLRFDKCKFLFEEIIYLGYHVSGGNS